MDGAAAMAIGSDACVAGMLLPRSCRAIVTAAGTDVCLFRRPPNLVTKDAPSRSTDPQLLTPCPLSADLAPDPGGGRGKEVHTLADSMTLSAADGALEGFRLHWLHSPQ